VLHPRLDNQGASGIVPVAEANGGECLCTGRPGDDRLSLATRGQAKRAQVTASIGPKTISTREEAKMNVSKAFTYVFDDERWIPKLLIGGVLSVIPIANFIPSGYALQTFRNAVRRSQRPLPEWTDLGEMFGQGLLLFIIGFVYNLPVFLLTACLWTVGGALDTRGSGDEIRGAISLIQWCLTTPYGILMATLWPAIFSRFAMTGDVAGAFNFREIFAMMRPNPTDYAVVVILSIVLRFISGFGLLLCCVGVLFTAFWTSLVRTHLFADLYVETVGVQAEATGIESM
jgi:hypothetical protein